MNPKSCVVVGAGLSGLSAAHLLTKNDWEVTVLEAEKWIGGRVYSFESRKHPNSYASSEANGSEKTTMR